MKKKFFIAVFALLPSLLFFSPWKSYHGAFAEESKGNLDVCLENDPNNYAFSQIKDDFYATPQESYYENYAPHYIINNRDSIPNNTNIVKNVFLTGTVSYQCFDPNNFGQITSTPQVNYYEEIGQTNNNRGVVQNPKNWDYIATARIVMTFYNVHNNKTGGYDALSFIGTAFLEGPYLAVTAAHCTYGDVTVTTYKNIGNQTISDTTYEDNSFNPRFADKIEFYFGLNGSNEISEYYQYYAKADVAYIELDYALTCEMKRDWAAIELDRNMGSLIGGWYGKISNITTAGYSVTSYGYPGNSPIPDKMYEYSGIIIDNPDNVGFKIDYSIAAVGGQSGSPIFWENENGDKYVCGILSAINANGIQSGGPYFTNFIFNFLNQYFTSNYNGYSYPNLHFNTVQNNAGNYKIRIINDTSWIRFVEYNSKMCFYNDGINWQNLLNKVTITINPYSSVLVTISKNWFADAIVASYTYAGKRVITCANNVQNSQPSEHYNLINS